MNNTEREAWIDNDEGLYNWWKSSKKPVFGTYTGQFIRLKSMTKREFIAENREAIDAAIENVTSNKKPAHYLAYPQ